MERPRAAPRLPGRRRRRHDDGWAVWERSPLVGDDGAPVGFLDVHVPAHLAFYRAGIAAVTDEDPYAGLLVSMHGAGIYRQRYGADTGLSLSRAAEVQPLVDAFVEEQESAFPERSAAVGVDEELRWADYHRLQWFDRFSLAFCLREWDHPGEAPFELGTFTFSPLGPWRAKVSPIRSPALPRVSRCFAGSSRRGPGRRPSSGATSSTSSPPWSRSSSSSDLRVGVRPNLRPARGS